MSSRIGALPGRLTGLGGSALPWTRRTTRSPAPVPGLRGRHPRGPVRTGPG
ncbi:hypothetical protein ACFW9V_21785 [Streptomyces hygroscopicus]|uniref:hypothetical protein n=1 Tax=Streptomyces hygroscopicus TaxID=1912 RepID=UPI000AAD4683|nr:hypothetical protein [Streptomyces sp. SRF1]